MKALIFLLIQIIAVLFYTNASSQSHRVFNDSIRHFDIIIVGGTPGGIMAAVSAARMGKSSLLIERTNHIGGLPANGLGATDISTRGATAGLFLEFIDRIYAHYVTTYGLHSQQVTDVDEGYHFEPSVAERVFESMLAEHAEITVLRMRQFDALPDRVTLENGYIQEIGVVNRLTGALERYGGRVFIDATYEGDLAAAAGVPFLIGRESREAFDEPFAGRVYKYWDGPAESGSTFQADNAIQAYNYRLPLTTRSDIKIPVTKPDTYNRDEYISLIEDVWTGRHTGEAVTHLTEEARLDNKRRRLKGEMPIVPGQPIGMQRIVNKVVLPNGKTDANNQHLAFVSTDLPEENWPWPTSSWAWRDRFARRLRDYTLGLLWFAQNDPELPDAFRDMTRQWGLSADEYVDNDYFPRQVYVREGRRIQGEHFFTAHDALPVTPGGRPPIHAGSITASHYAVDSHAVRKREPDRVHLDGFLSYQTRPYTVPFGVIVPVQVENLLTPVPVSGTHLGFSTLRMEPCWMALGQAAGVAAVLSISGNTPVRSISIQHLQQTLLAQNAVLIYYEDTSPDHLFFHALQFFGLLGFVPEWEARLDDPVQAEEALAWLSRSGLTTPIPYQIGRTKRGEYLHRLYKAIIAQMNSISIRVPDF